MNTIVSKRTGPFVYTEYVKVNGSFFRKGPSIVINGGAGIVGGSELLSGRPLNNRDSLIPVGVHTYVDDEALEKLMRIDKFKSDLKRGIVFVVKGKKLDSDKVANIAEKEMIEDDHIPTRPVSEKDITDAGGRFTKDGSIDISAVDEDMSPVKIRRINAGQPDYVKKRNAEARKSRRARKGE